VTCLDNHNSKSDLQAHSKLLVFVPFDRPYMIFCYHLFPKILGDHVVPEWVNVSSGTGSPGLSRTNFTEP